MDKIIITVEGGTIQSIYSSNAKLDVEIIDHDNLIADGLLRTERECLEQESTKGMTEIY